MNETRKYQLYKIKQNDLMRGKHKKTLKYLNYVEHLLILASKVNGCILISVFA